LVLAALFFARERMLMTMMVPFIQPTKTLGLVDNMMVITMLLL
jgi:hypothetical protein